VAQAQQPFDIGCAVQLTSLALRCSFTGDDDFCCLFSQFSSLQCLDISASRCLTDDGLRGITRLAGSLTALALQGGHGVSQDGATALSLLPNLRSLDLAYRCRQLMICPTDAYRMVCPLGRVYHS
jgi:hypothetical protein